MKELVAARARLAESIGTPDVAKFAAEADTLEHRAMLTASTEEDLLEERDLQAEEDPLAQLLPKYAQSKDDVRTPAPTSSQGTPVADFGKAQSAPHEQTVQSGAPTAKEAAPSSALPQQTVPSITPENEYAERLYSGDTRNLNDLHCELVLDGATLRELKLQRSMLLRAMRLNPFGSLQFHIGNLAEALKSDERYVEFAKYTDLRSNKPKYAAFFIGRDKGVEDVQFVELGSCELVDKEINDWLQTVIEPPSGATSTKTTLASLGSGARSIGADDPDKQVKPDVDECVLRKKLIETVWQPLFRAIPATTKRLWLCTDGELARLPWQFLTESATGNGAGPEILICQVDGPRQLGEIRESQKTRLDPDAIFRSLPGSVADDQNAKKIKPSATHEKTPVHETALLVGDLDYKNAPPLPATSMEIARIGKLMQSNGVSITAMSKQGGTLPAVLDALPDCTYAHFATHGYFIHQQANAESVGVPLSSRAVGEPGVIDPILQRSPLLQSGLLLSEGDKPEYASGKLPALELLGTNLKKCKLLVLSACETGRGDEISGQGVIGLRTAALAAGAHTVVMSLWKVSDAATQQLMVYFYENYFVHKMNPYVALAQAQYQLRQDPAFHDPYYWAGWVVVGSD
jgi:hypothetical protein